VKRAYPLVREGTLAPGESRELEFRAQCVGVVRALFPLETSVADVSVEDVHCYLQQPTAEDVMVRVRYQSPHGVGARIVVRVENKTNEPTPIGVVLHLEEIE
jgi:hypothetical protein